MPDLMVGCRAVVVGATLFCAVGGGAAALHGATPDAAPLQPVARIAHTGPAQVAISGDTLIFVSHDADTGVLGGDVSVYQRRNGRWMLDTVLRPPHRVAGGDFGYALAISGDTIAVAAPDGAVLVYVRGTASPGGRSTWSLQVAIPPPAGEQVIHFGRSLALAGDLLVVGAPSDLGDQTVGGGAFIFRRTGGAWHRSAYIFFSQNNFYGDIVAITSIAGLPPLAQVGSVGGVDTYELGPHGWVLQGAPVPPQYIAAIALSGDVLAEAALGRLPNPTGLTLWHFGDGAWTLEATLPEGEPVALDGPGGTLAAVSTDGTSVAVYRRAGPHGPWGLAATLATPGGDPNARFNASLALSDGTAVVSFQDSVWVFDLGDSSADAAH